MRAAVLALTLGLGLALVAGAAACGGDDSFLPRGARRDFAQADQAFARGATDEGCAGLQRGLGDLGPEMGLGLRGARAAQAEMLIGQLHDLGMLCASGGNPGPMFTPLRAELEAVAARRATWGTYVKWLGVIAAMTFVAWLLRHLRPAR